MRYKNRPTRNARQDVASRFWAKVNRSTPEACWEWTASLNGGRYGQFQWDRKMIRSHRVAFMLVKGTIPPGASVLHTCDNQQCCNPAHLFLGTQQDNMTDKKLKGRARTVGKAGENNPAAKITAEVAEKIRQLWALKVMTQTQIGDLFDIDQTTVSLIVRGRIWTQ